MAHLAIIATGDARARVEDDLARVLDALAAAEEDGRMSEVEIASLPNVAFTRVRGIQRLGVLPLFPRGQGQGSHGGRLPESLGADFCLWLRMLCVQTQHLQRPAGDSEWHA